MKRYPMFRMRGLPEGEHAFSLVLVTGMMLREVGAALDAIDEIDQEDNKLAPLNLPPQGDAIRGMLPDRVYWSMRRLINARSAVLAVCEIGAAIEKIAEKDERVRPAHSAFLKSFPDLHAVRNSIAHPHERAMMPLPEDGSPDEAATSESLSDQVSIFGSVVSREFAVDVRQRCLRTVVRELVIRVRTLGTKGGRTVHFRVDDSILDNVQGALSLMTSAVDDTGQAARSW